MADVSLTCTCNTCLHVLTTQQLEVGLVLAGLHNEINCNTMIASYFEHITRACDATTFRGLQLCNFNACNVAMLAM